MGYDPLIQFLHPDDALAAFLAALDARASGVFNIVPRDTISLLTALHLAEKVTIPVPHPLAKVLADGAWSTGFGEAPGGFVDYIRYLFVADGAKARRGLAFEPSYGSCESLLDYLAYRYPDRHRAAVGAATEARP
jgi:UDP-glucose 4-epimerase